MGARWHCGVSVFEPDPCFPRRYAWSLPGRIKNGRQDAIDAFVASGIMGEHVSGLMDPEETVITTQSSSFVLSGRGNVNGDCFRHYESSILGAIPAMRSTLQERESDYSRFCVGGLPPFVFGDNWTGVAATVRQLLRTPAALREWQLELVGWWTGNMRCTRKRIALALGPQSERADKREARTRAQACLTESVTNI